MKEIILNFKLSPYDNTFIYTNNLMLIYLAKEGVWRTGGPCDRKSENAIAACSRVFANPVIFELLFGQQTKCDTQRISAFYRNTAVHGILM